MIVAIARSGSGQVVVEEFRAAASTAAAVTAFVNEYTPAKPEADYIGHDPGWTSVQNPGADKSWNYDHGTGLLVAIAVNRVPFIQVDKHTVASLPAASSSDCGLAIITDEVGGSVLAFCDGTDWRRSTDRAIVS